MEKTRHYKSFNYKYKERTFKTKRTQSFNSQSRQTTIDEFFKKQRNVHKDIKQNNYFTDPLIYKSPNAIQNGPVTQYKSQKDLEYKAIRKLHKKCDKNLTQFKQFKFVDSQQLKALTCNIKKSESNNDRIIVNENKSVDYKSIRKSFKNCKKEYSKTIKSNTQPIITDNSAITFYKYDQYLEECNKMKKEQKLNDKLITGIKEISDDDVRLFVDLLESKCNNTNTSKELGLFNNLVANNAQIHANEIMINSSMNNNKKTVTNNHVRNIQELENKSKNNKLFEEPFSQIDMFLTPFDIDNGINLKNVHVQEPNNNIDQEVLNEIVIENKNKSLEERFDSLEKKAMILNSNDFLGRNSYKNYTQYNIQSKPTFDTTQHKFDCLNESVLLKNNVFGKSNEKNCITNDNNNNGDVCSETMQEFIENLSAEESNLFNSFGNDFSLVLGLPKQFLVNTVDVGIQENNNEIKSGHVLDTYDRKEYKERSNNSTNLFTNNNLQTIYSNKMSQALAFNEENNYKNNSQNIDKMLLNFSSSCSQPFKSQFVEFENKNKANELDYDDHYDDCFKKFSATFEDDSYKHSKDNKGNNSLDVCNNSKGIKTNNSLKVYKFKDIHNQFALNSKNNIKNCTNTLDTSNLLASTLRQSKKELIYRAKSIESISHNGIKSREIFTEEFTRNKELILKQYRRKTKKFLGHCPIDRNMSNTNKNLNFSNQDVILDIDDAKLKADEKINEMQENIINKNISDKIDITKNYYNSKTDCENFDKLWNVSLMSTNNNSRDNLDIVPMEIENIEYNMLKEKAEDFSKIKQNKHSMNSNQHISKNITLNDRSDEVKINKNKINYSNQHISTNITTTTNNRTDEAKIYTNNSITTIENTPICNTENVDTTKGTNDTSSTVNCLDVTKNKFTSENTENCNVTSKEILSGTTFNDVFSQFVLHRKYDENNTENYLKEVIILSDINVFGQNYIQNIVDKNEPIPNNTNNDKNQQNGHNINNGLNVNKTLENMEHNSKICENTTQEMVSKSMETKSVEDNCVTKNVFIKRNYLSQYQQEAQTNKATETSTAKMTCHENFGNKLNEYFDTQNKSATTSSNIPTSSNQRPNILIIEDNSSTNNLPVKRIYEDTNKLFSRKYSAKMTCDDSFSKKINQYFATQAKNSSNSNDISTNQKTNISIIEDNCFTNSLPVERVKCIKDYNCANKFIIKTNTLNENFSAKMTSDDSLSNKINQYFATQAKNSSNSYNNATYLNPRPKISIIEDDSLTNNLPVERICEKSIQGMVIKSKCTDTCIDDNSCGNKLKINTNTSHEKSSAKMTCDDSFSNKINQHFATQSTIASSSNNIPINSKKTPNNSVVKSFNLHTIYNENLTSNVNNTTTDYVDKPCKVKSTESSKERIKHSERYSSILDIINNDAILNLSQRTRLYKNLSNVSTFPNANDLEKNNSFDDAFIAEIAGSQSMSMPNFDLDNATARESTRNRILFDNRNKSKSFNSNASLSQKTFSGKLAMCENAVLEHSDGVEILNMKKAEITLIPEDNRTIQLKLKENEPSKILNEDLLPIITIHENTNKKIPQLTNSGHEQLSDDEEQFFSNSQQLIRTGLNKITNDVTLKLNFYHNKDPSLLDDNAMKSVLQKIEIIFNRLINNLCSKKNSAVKVPNRKNWKSCVYKNNRLIFNSSKFSTVYQGRRQSRKHFNSIMFVLAKIVELHSMKLSCTKRELYYQYKEFFKSQVFVNEPIMDACALLNIPPWQVGLFSTAKSLVYGNAIIETVAGNINCNVKGGALIPQNASDIIKMKSSAYFLLIVEKDAIFQKLLEENLPNKLTRPFILFTGKGYADMNTRVFLKKLLFDLQIPAFILVDGDPCGIEIMLSYRFGTLATCYLSEYLAIPNLRWIGIHPSDISSLDITSQPMNEKEIAKLDLLLTRPYMKHNIKIKEQLLLLKEIGRKAEIEGLNKHENFISDVYLADKLHSKDYI